jgi:hypothetical protein
MSEARHAFYRSAVFVGVGYLMLLLWLNHAMLRGAPNDVRAAYYLLASFVPAMLIGAVLEVRRAYLAVPDINGIDGLIMVATGAVFAAAVWLITSVFY